ncbi:hypothetical protein F5Y05DRAFT_221712 [Hypoxylon sp. FL0543]|nr:hypothetical protein F5Y05DRAFT_221712 [Hypoxylon sp. FL0543]
MRERQSANADIPSPLHIIKKGKSMQVLRSSPRKFSCESVDDGPKQPLTVLKRRKSHGRKSTSKSQSVVNGPVPDQSFEGRSRSATVNSASSITWDPVTPKPRKAPVSRRSSSLQVGRSLSPTFLTKLRSLSRRTTSLSSKPAHSRKNSRVLSDSSDDSVFKSSDVCETTSSWNQSSKSSYPGPPSYVSESDTQSFDSQPFIDIQTPDNSIPDPYMLIPHISITPESRTLTDGQPTIWAAIEISGQLFHPRAGDPSYGTTHPGAAQAPFLPASHCDAGLSGYGYLYDIRVDILPTAEGNVIDLIGDTTIRTISPGSSLLMLACIRLGASSGQTHRALKHEPDNLIEDLEFQLGSIQTEYVHVRLNYCHSGFPAFRNTLIEDGISAQQTRIETTATGTMKRLSPASTWSPRPVPTSNPLFAIIASHWGPARANEVMGRIAPHRSNTRRPAYWPVKNDAIIKTPDRTGTAPPIPQRQASLKRPSPDPARKIWTELRRTSSGNRPAFHVSKANRLPAATTFVDAPSPLPPPTTRPESSARPETARSEVLRQREQIRELAVRNKRSIGADSLKSLVPSVAELSIEGKENSSPGSPSPPGKVMDMRFDGQKREGRWSLGNWW